MKRILLIILFFSLSAYVSAQTSDQLKMLESMSPSQIEKLKKSSFAKNITDKNEVGDKVKAGKSSQWAVSDDVLEAYREEMDVEEFINATVYDSLIKQRRFDRRNMVFGHEIFSRKNLTFAPAINIPTPPSYTLGGGDELLINVWGAAEHETQGMINPDGFINIEGVGLIPVRGLTVKEATNKIKSYIAGKYEGVQEGAISVNVSLGKIRTVTVNVAGEAKVPGTYTLPSLATVFNALYAAGGVSEIGSVRDISLYRNSKKIASLDVYDFLINGKTEINQRLEDDDLIVVEPYISIVRASGSIKRPMKYEMKANEPLEKLIKYAGGFNGEALRNNISVSRSADGKQLNLFTIDKGGFNYFMMMDNDSVYVSKVMQRYANKLSISGEVWQAGNFELKEGISKVSELVKQAGGITPQAFAGRALLYRLNDDFNREVIGININEALEGINDIELKPNDSLRVFSMEYFNQLRAVTVVGEVTRPDTLQYGAGMTLKDALVACGGFNLSASHARIEISRRVNDPNAEVNPDAVAEIFTFKVNGDLSINQNTEQFLLMPFDEIFVRQSPGYIPQMNVVVQGEVLFEGQYTLHHRVTKLSDIIERSGGLTKDAYAKGAYLRRQKTEFDIERERSLVNLRNNSNPTDTMMVKFDSIGSYYSVAIDLLGAMADPHSGSNIELKMGDKIVVPTYTNTVKISGAVYYPNTVTYVPGKHINHYIDNAGGYSERARRKPFVVYQNGMVYKRGRVIEPGSEIVIPYKPYKEPMGPATWISLSTSVISMASMIMSLFK